ncbi:Wzz/FepE/Etk N-terminal domain-containing protein [Bosea sp. AS-1]|uniref:Wzz/FepE/Etk N-terminal domain-containing protein n=1 Tax=Bosea sp. AS-1 TaxID=2015316 RepID=UPI000B76E105|nr:Wzz/FepE/Etk N-terminal domain-containing protein [Bosea sp. AS-1]
MLQQIHHRGDGNFAARDEVGSGTIDLDALLSGARRQAKVVIGAIVICVLLAAIYLATATKLYTASTDILIDGRNFGANKPEDTQIVLANSAVDSQVEVVKSQRVINGVIDKLKLLEDPEFAEPSAFSSLFGWILPRRSEDIEGAQEELRRKVTDKLLSRLNVQRLNKTFILSVDFLSRDPVKAATIANAIADGYLLEQLDSKYDATRRASAWLQDRIAELRDKSLESDRAVQQFREKNNLIQAGGRLINDQSLSELNTQLSLARSQRALAEARFAQIQSIIETRQMNAAVPEALSSPVINDLRTRYLNAAKRMSELVDRLGTNHVQVLAARKELRDYEDQVFTELSRIAESVKSELQTSREREQSLQESLDKLIGASAADNMTLVTLREKEREAESYRGLYQTFLQRNQELIQQQSYPVTDARVITRATKPGSATQPRTLLVLAFSLVAGLASGVGLAMIREYRDIAFRTGDQVRSELGVEFLGIVPVMTAATTPRPDPSSPLSGINPYLIASITDPLSRLADTMRTVKVSLDFEQSGPGAKILGLVSSYSGEGKTMISVNLAMLLGSTGARTLLIDGDLRRFGLSRELAKDAEYGLADVVQGKEPLGASLKQLGGLNVWLLASPPDTRVAHSSEILLSEGMKKLIEAASTQFDYIVIDLPPLGALVDARAIEPIVPNFLLVVEWGDTPRESVRNMLDHNPNVHAKCIGTILNKADPVRIGNYISDKRNFYSYSSY